MLSAVPTAARRIAVPYGTRHNDDRLVQLRIILDDLLNRRIVLNLLHGLLRGLLNLRDLRLDLFRGLLCSLSNLGNLRFDLLHGLFGLLLDLRTFRLNLFCGLLRLLDATSP